MDDFNTLIDHVHAWADKRELLKEENANKQMLKVMEEVGELAGALAKQRDRAEVIDGIGDSFVTLIILSFQLGLEPHQCLGAAYQEIKDRTGKNVGGTFVKDE
jgi:NTP pyrophosphatase (non-canonical NTP hydrolase)